MKLSERLHVETKKYTLPMCNECQKGAMSMKYNGLLIACLSAYEDIWRTGEKKMESGPLHFHLFTFFSGTSECVLILASHRLFPLWKSTLLLAKFEDFNRGFLHESRFPHRCQLIYGFFKKTFYSKYKLKAFASKNDS